MDVDTLPDTRKQIRILVSQRYHSRRVAPVFTQHSQEEIISFRSFTDPRYEHLRRLHDKAVQAVPVTASSSCQTAVHVPFSRWVETEPPSVVDSKETVPVLSKAVVDMMLKSVSEASTVDVLVDDWGGLERVAGQHEPAELTLMPRKMLAFRSEEGDETKMEAPSMDAQSPEEVQYDTVTLARMLSEEDSRSGAIDILKLHTMQRKLMKRLHEKRAAAAAAETPLQGFSRHLDHMLKRYEARNKI